MRFKCHNINSVGLLGESVKCTVLCALVRSKITLLQSRIKALKWLTVC
ncbi:unnamed protein product [Arabidopsis halleri]